MEKLYYVFLVFILIVLLSCQRDSKEKNECLKYIDEKYTEKIDSTMQVEAHKFHEYLLKKFGENSIKEMNYEAYHLQFYSSHGYGESVKFENKNGSYSLSVKCEGKKEWSPECKSYQISINADEWGELEKMIYEFNFWTAEDFRVNKDILDGYAFFLEGNRPEAEKCNKKTYKLVGRGSPRYDKMEALCYNILEYEEQLKFKYEQMNKIN